MPYDYFVRITHSYESIKVLVGLWALRADKFVVYEHTGSKTEKVHCHILILGSNTHKKQLRNIGLLYNDLKGNENCSFKECISWETPVVYMTKGNLSPSYLKGFTEADANVWKSKWVEPVKYVKKSRCRLLYEELFPLDGKHPQPTPEDYDSPDYLAFHKIRVYVKREVFKRSKDQMWTQQCLSDYKSIVYTYCFNAEIPIPNNEWKKWI